MRLPPHLRATALLIACIASPLAGGRALPALAAPAPCPGGRFLLPGEPPLVPGDIAPEIEAVIVEAGAVAIASGCPPAEAKVRGGRRGTRVRATWPKGVCGGPPRKLRLKARIDPTCTSLRGSLKGNGLKRRFTAPLSACGDGILDRGGDVACPLLEGPPDGLALDATSDLDAPTAIPPAANDVDADGRPLVRTRIELVFTGSATVGQVNALISGVGGRIVSMLAGVPSVVLDLPDPGSVTALDALVADLVGDPAVRFVLKAYEPVPEVLPDNYSAPLGDPAAARIDHQLAVRAAAAWNARAAMGQSPTIAVLDYFGDGVPDGAFDMVAPSPSDFSSAGQGSDGEHGYHVVGIFAGRFGGPNTDRGQVTGIFPGTSVVRISDIQDPNTDFRTEQNRVLDRLRNGAPNGILNTSLGEPCARPLLDLVVEAAWWAEKIRALGLESRVLHTTAAGNLKPACPLEVDATVNSSYAAAALFPLPVPNLTNVLVVENATNGGRPTFAPSCLAPGSKFPGHLAGIGTAVFSFTDADSGAGDKNGTSMASPQVAGLAAYLWSLEPAMSVQQVRQALLATTAAPAGDGAGCAPSAPVIDAYAATLSLDAAALPDPIGAPVRTAILDVDDSGGFDEGDVAAFVDAFIDPGTGDPREPADPDFGRHDLNGDGFTGGPQRTARFDLDRIDSVQFGESGHGVVFQTAAGIDIPFDEERASDLDILCYYAHSALFEGTAAARDAALPLRRCVRVRIDATLPAQVTPDVAVPLEIRVVALRADGTELAPLAGVHVELTPSGGTVGAPAGVTDAQGAIETTATANAGAGSLAIDVVVRTAPGGEILGDTSAQAAVGGVDCTPFTDALSLKLIAAGVNSQDQFGDVGETLTDTMDLGDRHAMAEVSMGAVHVTAQMDDGAGGDVGRSIGAITSFQDHIVLTPSNPALIGTAGTLTARIEVTATGSAGGDGFGFWSFNLTPLGQISRNGRFTELGYEGAALGVQDLTFGVAFGQDFFLSFSFSTVASLPAQTSGAAQIEASIRFVGYVEARDAEGNPVGFSVCTNFPPPTTTTSSLTTTSTSSVTTTSTVSSTTTTLPGGGATPYRVYDATGPDGPQVTLVDRFRTESVDLGSVRFFLPPAGLDGVPLPSQFPAHTCYVHTGAPFAGTADVVHALASQSLTLGDPQVLCAPDAPSAIPVDHYICYDATGDPLDQSHVVSDEFQSATVQLLSPLLFCLPAGVDGAPPVDPLATFACYATDPPGTSVGPVGIANAFQEATLDVAAPIAVCLPALATTSPAP